MSESEKIDKGSERPYNSLEKIDGVSTEISSAHLTGPHPTFEQTEERRITKGGNKEIPTSSVIISREGRANADPKPPKGYVVIGTHRTGGGGHRYYAYGKINSATPDELIRSFKSNPELFGGGDPHFIPDGKNLIIYTRTPGSWIGSKGRWINSLSAVLQEGGRINIKELLALNMRGDRPSFGTFLRSDSSLVKTFLREAGEKMLDRKCGMSMLGAGATAPYDYMIFKSDDREWLNGWVDRLKEAEEQTKQSLEEGGKNAKKITETYKEFANFTDNTQELVEIIEDKEWLGWALDKAKKLSGVLSKDKPTIYRNHIYVGGAFPNQQILSKIQEQLQDADYEIIPDRYRIVRK